MDKRELTERYERGERNFAGFDLCEADLSGANLSGANLSGAILRGADLEGVSLHWAEMSGVVF